MPDATSATAEPTGWRDLVGLPDDRARVAAVRALATLSAANRALVQASDEVDLLTRSCRTIAATGGYPLAWYGRPVDDAEKSVAVVASAGEHVGYLDHIRTSWGDNPLGRGPTGRALRLGEVQILDRFESDPHYDPWRSAAAGEGFACSISLPVRVRGEIDGALMVYADEPGAFDRQAQDLLGLLAEDLGYGIARLRDAIAGERAREEAERHRARLEATLNSLLDPFALLEVRRDDAGRAIDLRFIDVNVAAVVDYRMPREEIIGADILRVSDALRGQGLVEGFVDTIGDHVPLVLDDYLLYRGPERTPRWYDIRAVQIGDLVALTWRDVTARHEAEQRLADSEQRYRLLAENASDVVLMAGPDLRFSWVSASVTESFGWRPDDLLGRGPEEIIHPDDVAAVRSAIATASGSAGEVRMRYRFRCADGSHRWVAALGRRAVDDQGRVVGRVIGLRDVEDVVRAEQELAAREEQYRLLAENASDVVWQVSPDGRLAWASESVTTVLGWPREQLIGRVGMELIHPDDRGRAVARRAEVLAGHEEQGEYRVECADGGFRWMSLTVRLATGAGGAWRIVAMRDIQDEVLARQELQHALGHDRLTGLSTRATFLTHLADELTRLPEGAVLGVLWIGVDGLRAVNDALTHAGGDVVLERLAARLASAVAGPERLGRASGDEFAVLTRPLADPADAVPLAEAVLTAVRDPMTIGGHRIDPTVSIGIATGGRDAGAEQLLRDGALAMRQAKDAGRNRWAVLDPAVSQEAQRRLDVEAAIREALLAGEFVPYLQPIVALSSGALVGYEALVRRVQQDGTVSVPVDFLAVAESRGLVADIDHAVLEASLAWLARLPADRFVAVNASPATVGRAGYADQVLAAMDRHGVAPHRLHLEVTETALLTVTGDVEHALAELSGAGIRWYVDDFGTGYSSISHLRDLPIAGMKLDRSFTEGIREGDETCVRLAQALAGLAEGLRLDTVAEGVETAAEARVLVEQGWRHAQGWLYGRPAAVPIDLAVE